MLLDKSLLTSLSDPWATSAPPDPSHIRGSYSPWHFALRLAPNIHKELHSVKPGIFNVDQLGFPTIQAFSTYLHETVHWWQHIGSNLGLFLSFIYPVQAHVNHRDLKYLLENLGPTKSILEYNELNAKPAHEETEVSKRVNRVLNNWYDIHFCEALIIDPQEAKHLLNERYFECVGHSYTVTWAQTLALLSDCFDSSYEFLPKIKNWEKTLDTYRDSREEGYFHGSPVRLPPFGAKHIFEGQAKFTQLQFLHIASNREVGWADFRMLGMLDGVYVEAFEMFLKLTGASWPDTPLSPTVGLFLLVCDISINPTDGFPFDVIHFPSFVYSVDPGTRFVLLCNAIQTQHEHIANDILNYSKDEYINACSLLCKAISCISPYDSARIVTGWANKYVGCTTVLSEDESFSFSPENMPVRLLFARFLRFQQDKFEHPEFFCWPGFWMTGVHKNGIAIEYAQELYDKHRALFVNSYDDNIYPRTFTDKSETNVQKTFDTFFAWNATYELTRQWIIEKGHFEYDFSWLTTKYTNVEAKDWANSHFELAYGTNPKSFNIL